VEAKIDSLTDLEASWADMARVPYQAEYQKKLSELIISGSSRWTIHRVIDSDSEAR
jgi:hypothetical protein